MTNLILATPTDKKISVAKGIIAQHDNGKRFTAVNVKKDGTLRTYRLMSHVQAGLKGGESTTAHKKNLVTLFDVDVNEYRAINLETLLMLQFDGVEPFIFLDTTTADAIAEQSVKVTLFSAAAVAETVLKVVNKAIGQ